MYTATKHDTKKMHTCEQKQKENYTDFCFETGRDEFHVLIIVHLTTQNAKRIKYACILLYKAIKSLCF